MPSKAHSRNDQNPTKKGPYKPELIIHGGAGSISRANLPPDLYKKYHDSLLTYLISTHDLLSNQGANAVDAACHAVSLMEDDELFNCGKGAVFTVDGECEMEASLMVASPVSSSDPGLGVDGVSAKMVVPGLKKKNAAVSMLKHTRHPILLAKEVLVMADDEDDDNSKNLPTKAFMHGHLSGSHVEEWGFSERGLEKKEKEYFWTRRRWNEHRRELGKDASDEAWKKKLSGIKGDADECTSCIQPATHCHHHHQEEASSDMQMMDLPSQGTVGAVCMDSWGNLCVATSTGGLTNKRTGRIGDTPSVGAGFWAECWDEQFDTGEAYKHDSEDDKPSTEFNGGQSVTNKLTDIAKQAMNFWIGDCLPHTFVENDDDQDSQQLQHRYSRMTQEYRHSQSMLYNKTTRPLPTKHKSKVSTNKITRATAISGTGNGDSFLRTAACRSASAIARYSSPFAISPSSSSFTPRERGHISLQTGVSRVVGPGGELQHSAGSRWGKTGEGEGGMIGIEVVVEETSSSLEATVDDLEIPGGRQELKDVVHVHGEVVSDFNCGGMWRAYYDEQGNPKVMVFKEEY